MTKINPPAPLALLARKMTPFVPLVLMLISFTLYLYDAMFKLDRFHLFNNEIIEGIVLVVLLFYLLGFYLLNMTEIKKPNLLLIAVFLVLILISTVKWEFDTKFFLVVHFMCYVSSCIILLFALKKQN